jgi:hypothetical protein
MKLAFFDADLPMHNPGMIYGCARISTAAQDESGRVRQLKAGSVISSRPVVASTCAQHERSTTRARWALPGTRLVNNALQWFICVA